MGLFKRLFGGEADKRQPQSDDPQGIYLYVRCDRCGAPVRLRADKQYDLINEPDGYVWHKTVVDNRCFRPMPTVVRFNGKFEVISAEITGGRYITEAEYEALRQEQAAQAAAAKTAATGGDEPA